MKTLSSLVAICLILVGCQSDSSSNNQSPLVGTWITESCEQASDSSGSPVNIWLKGLYEFTSQGTILRGLEEYSDADCVALNKSIPPSDLDIPTTYVDKGPKLLQEGIDGAGLLIEVNIDDRVLPFDGFYAIIGEQLCFSDNFTFEVLSFGFSGFGTNAIDFSNCLIRWRI